MADSIASAPAPRGLPLSVQAPSRHSAVLTSPRSVAQNPSSSASDEDWEDSAAPALESPRGSDDDGPPLEELEAQMHEDVASQAASDPQRSSREVSNAGAEIEENDETSSSIPLPELDELRARLPAEVRETLDELFRARFVSVKKLPRRVFTSGARRE